MMLAERADRRELDGNYCRAVIGTVAARRPARLLEYLAPPTSGD
jgi:hypothetical protein